MVANQPALFSGPLVLVVDDDPDVRKPLVRQMRGLGLDVVEAENLAQARARISDGGLALVVFDKMLPDGNGYSFALDLVEGGCDFNVVVLTGAPDAEEALEVGGKFLRYLGKPFQASEIKDLVFPLLRSSEAELEPNTRFVPERKTREAVRGGRLIGGKSMSVVSNEISRVADMETTVIIRGPSGTGKEVVARKIHLKSRRRDGKFVAVNCAGLPSELIESELFGYEKGAFTGAYARTAGKFEEAHGGIIFLDEITEMPLKAQAKLLRVLQERVVTRLGSSVEIPVDVRVIAATNRDLAAEVTAKNFREDLYFRLKSSEICLLSLKDRDPEDIGKLIRHFAQRAVDEVGRAAVFSKEAWAALLVYAWPGNVRELENSVQHAVQSSGGVVLLSDLPREVREAVEKVDLGRVQRETSVTAASLVKALMELIDEGNEDEFPKARDMEVEYLKLVLRAVSGKRQKACSLLGVDRKWITRRLGPKFDDEADDDGIEASLVEAVEPELAEVFIEQGV